MTTSVQTLIALTWIVVVILVAFVLWRQAQTRRLRRQFGPEYDRALERHTSRTGAERELRDRERQVRAHYHALFDDLLAPEKSPTPAGQAGRPDGPGHIVGRPATRGRARPDTLLNPYLRR